jgi:hypothetical protein
VYQEVDLGLELTKFSAKPARVPEKTLSGKSCSQVSLHSQTQLNRSCAVGTHECASTTPYRKEGELVEAKIGAVQ